MLETLLMLSTLIGTVGNIESTSVILDNKYRGVFKEENTNYKNFDFDTFLVNLW